MKGESCKRMLVRAIGFRDGEIAYAENRNFNTDGCTNEAGKCGCLHAEVNLLKQMPNPNLVVVSHSPCINCAKALVEAGVKKVAFIEEYRIKDGLIYLATNNVKVEKIEGSPF